MKIVCFGDSVTRGISYINGRLRIVRENYPARLKKLLSQVSALEVVNKGVFNDNTDSLLQRLDHDVLQEVPDVVIIGAGGNDCNFRWDEVAKAPNESHSPMVELNRYLQNMKELAQRIHDVGALPVYLDLAPLDPVRYYSFLAGLHGNNIAHWIAQCGGIEYWHTQYSNALQKMIQSLNFPLISVRDSFAQSSVLLQLISDDGIHPTKLGYQLMSETIYQGFRKLYPSV